MLEDHEFHPKLGRLKKSRERVPKLFVAQVLAAAQLAGHVGRSWPARSPAGHTRADRGRGGVAAWRAAERRLYGNRARRVIVKARIVRQGFRATGAVRAHLSYLRREGVTTDGAAARMFDAVSDDADLRAFAERASDDRHHFRFIVSPEDATEMEDLRAFTRDLVKQMEHDLGTRLDWVGIDHWNTDNPHVHLFVRGADDRGDTLVIHRDYISHGMRERAVELVTIELGPQSEREVRRKLAGEVGADRWTRLDATLLREAQRTENGVLDFRPEVARSDAVGDEIRVLLIGRLQKLERMGLARAIGPARWLLAEEAEPSLRELGIRGDIIRTMQRALSAQGQDRSPSDFAIFDAPIASEQTIIGRVIEKGLHDELKGSAYLVLDGVDGLAHYLRVENIDGISEVSEGAVIAVGRAHGRRSDQTIARLAAAYDGIYDPERHRTELAHADAANPEALVEAHVRRLEALRRGGRHIERLLDGRWRIPDDYLDRARAYDVRHAAAPDIDVRTLSRLPLEAQVAASGATWLDRELVAREKPELAETGFGAEVRTALEQRTERLVDCGLARRRHGQAIFARDLLDTLTRRELADTATQIASQTGLAFRPVEEGDHVSGIYRRRVDLASGRFALIEDGHQFLLVPWRPIVDRQLGREVSGVLRGGSMSWNLGRERGLGI
jgi:type IV secretory pathway VirD2 relaxase